MFETQIEAGIAFLNERYPEWRETVDPETLDMNELDGCVLGQLTGSYWQAIEEATGEDRWSGPAFQWGVDHGFDVEDSLDFDTLTEEWRLKITEGQYHGVVA